WAQAGVLRFRLQFQPNRVPGRARQGDLVWLEVGRQIRGQQTSAAYREIGACPHLLRCQVLLPREPHPTPPYFARTQTNALCVMECETVRYSVVDNRKVRFIPGRIGRLHPIRDPRLGLRAVLLYLETCL